MNATSRSSTGGRSHMDEVLIEEELGWALGLAPRSVQRTGVGSGSLGGSEQIKNIPRDADQGAEARIILLDRADAGSDVSGMRTRAVKHGDKYLINGSRLHHQRGVHRLVHGLRQTDPDAGHRGISAFVVPRDAGVVVVSRGQDGQRASDTSAITFNDVEVRPQTCSVRTTASSSRDDADRTRPGRRDGDRNSPRGARIRRSSTPRSACSSRCRSRCTQAIQFIIADMAAKVHVGRLATWNSAVLLDQGKPIRSSPRTPSASRPTAR